MNIFTTSFKIVPGQWLPYHGSFGESILTITVFGYDAYGFKVQK
jgi:hypothetical protein